jgi:hypothetical protein
MTNKPGDIKMIFGNPAKCQHPIDQARLIEKISDQGNCEYWLVEYLNESSRKYPALIKKQDELELSQ